MPYPNEHAARVRDPGSFEPNSFRSKELKDGVRLILGKLKGGNDSMVVQAYRFSVDNFTVEQAKKWLEDNKVKFIKFEPANSVSEDNNLKHAGVKGMKWKERKRESAAALKEKRLTQESKERRTARRTKHTGKKSEDFEKAAESRKKQIDEMSNEELSGIAERMQLKKKYKDLDRSKINKGKKDTENVMSVIKKVRLVATSIRALSAIGNKVYMRIKTIQGSI